MKITKFIHSCLLVEMPAPVNRTVIFDPGVFSEEALGVDRLEYLDDIVITHVHPDHFSVELVKKLVAKFPEVRITSTQEVVQQLQGEGIAASTETPEGMDLFTAPHEDIFSGKPENVGVHYIDHLTHPGDSHSFTETKDILALPVSAPWGSAVAAYKLACKLKPKHVLPIHDWHWSETAQEQMYAKMHEAFAGQGIAFHKLETGKPIVIN